MCTFLISQTPTRAYHRYHGKGVVQSLDELLELQGRIECDLYISLPDEYGQRRVTLLDP